MIKERVILPSQGFPYNEKIEGNSILVTPITTRVYKDFLYSEGEDNLLNLVDSCLVECPLKAEDFCFADLLAVYIKIRSISLGNSIPVSSVCPKCNVKQETFLELNNLECNYLSIDKYPIEVLLPDSKTKISVCIPSSKSARIAKEEAQKRASNYNKPLKEFLPIYTTLIDIRLDSVKDLVSKADWYDNLSIKDAMFIDQVYTLIQDFGITTTQNVTCPSCKTTYKVPLQINKDFFRTTVRSIEGFKTTKGTLEKGPDWAGENV